MSEHNPFDLEGQEAAAADRRDAAAIELANELNDLKWLMGIKRGRRVVRRLLTEAGVYRSSYSESALQMAFKEGQRNGGLRLMAQVTAHCAEHYTLLLKEQSDNVD